MKARLRLPDGAALRALAEDAAARQRRGWQCHHILPRALSRHTQIATWLAAIEDVGPVLSARSDNILWLPATEELAARTGKALHRGPHPAYNVVVLERLEHIRQLATGADDARARIARLQQALSLSLTGAAPVALRLNRHDPMRLFADYGSLDSAIAALLPDGASRPP